MLTYVEEELNHIAVSKSGMQPELLQSMGKGIEAIAALRASGPQQRLVLPESEYVRWVEFACTYFAPQVR
jgi:hypothetical protein